MSILSRQKPLDLDRRLAGLRSAIDAGEGRLPEETLAPARALEQRAGARIGLGMEFTVVALAGATGSGKSTLFNLLAGAELSQTGVRRPTTGVAHAAVWGSADADGLLDWLDVARRHRAGEGAELDGLVLLDLPDHDSTQVEHRVEVDRLVGLVDVFVWIVDPQKYADAALHDGYLRPLATHAAVTLVVLNQIDRIDSSDVRRVGGDVRRLLEDDGLRKAEVLPVSARTGEGIDDLRRVLAARVSAKRAASERVAADLDRLHASLAPYCTDAKVKPIERRDRDRLVSILSVAAGAEVVAEATARSHLRDASLATGWPFTRWLRRLRPDPLARLHLGRGTSGGRTSLPGPGSVQRAQVDTALRGITQEATDGLPAPWPDAVRARAMPPTDVLLESLDRAVSRAEIETRRPVWWSVAGGVQMLLAIAAIVGFLWLGVLFVLEWFQVPKPPLPKYEDIPWPTILLVGGLLLGFLLAPVFFLFARIGAARRKRRAFHRLRDEVAEVAQDDVLGPLESELQAHRDFCAALTTFVR